jgi:hypothetical protein
VVPGCEGVGVGFDICCGRVGVGCWGRWEGCQATRFSPGAREEGAGEWVKGEEGFDGGVPGSVVRAAEENRESRWGGKSKRGCVDGRRRV